MIKWPSLSSTEMFSKNPDYFDSDPRLVRGSKAKDPDRLNIGQLGNSNDFRGQSRVAAN
jgi:hypothetical protein